MIKKTPNKALHLTAIPLCSISASELDRYAYITHNRYISGIDPAICLLIGASNHSYKILSRSRGVVFLSIHSV